MKMVKPTYKNTLGVILAGGKSIRMGQPHKGLIPLTTTMTGSRHNHIHNDHHNNTIIHTTVKTLRPQVEHLVLNVNDKPHLYEAFNLPIIQDQTHDGGPLAGIQSAMHYAKNNTKNTQWLLISPCDCPYLPSNLLDYLTNKNNNPEAEVITPQHNGRQHYVIGIWSITLEGRLKRFLDEGERKVGQFVKTVRHNTINYPIGNQDPFFNVNTPKDIQKLHRERQKDDTK